MLLFDHFKSWFEKLIVNLFFDMDLKDIIIDFDYNDNNLRMNFGDLSTNIAFLLAKKLKENPKNIADKIKNLIQSYEYIAKVELAGCGFINIYFKDDFYKKYYKLLLNNKNFIYKKIESNKKYNIEFVSANPTGPLHIGHGRGAIIGDVCAKVLSLKGYDVTSEYYINDTGVQIEKLGKSVYYYYALLCCKTVEFPEDGYKGYYILDIADLIYKEYSHSLIKEKLEFFSNYSKEFLLQRIKKTLLNYQVDHLVWFSEVILHDDKSIDKSIKILSDNRYTYESDDGAIFFKSTLFGDEKDRVLKKTDGSWTYTAADVAYFLNKLDRGFTDIVMVLGQDHHSFKIRIEAIAKALGFDISKLNIILYQLVTLKNEGEIIRMSKRKGNSVELQSIIDEVGSDVARFFYLQRKADTHLDFDIKEALEKSNKNPVFYIQYAVVRIKSILEKADSFIDIKDYIKNIDNINLTDNEKILLRKINLFDFVLDQICNSFNPHILTYYAIELSTLFHSFYTVSSIISDDKELTAYRIGLIYLVKQVLEKCVELLGISIPERM